ncbi:MAG: hypothetical protein R3325_00790 [Thermoanaerobaculia bacterium]|nr:hypothetical protein [Thermoanaerobaculia bacterium]
MAAGSGRFWYKIKVETLRIWVFLGVVAALGLVAFSGWGYVQRALLSGEIEKALEEGRELVHTLRSEPDLLSFRTEFDTGRRSLEEAQTQLAEDDLDAAWTSAERGRTLLRSILNGLRNEGPSGEAQFISVAGDVEFRRGEQGEWLPARRRVTLFPGDYVKTAGGGSAEVMTVDGTLFTVRPSTVILVDQRSSRGERNGERTIALRSGWVNLSTSQAASRVATPRAEARVAGRSAASVSYDEAARKARFTAHRGEVSVTGPGGTRQLGERQQVEQTGDRLSDTKTLPPAPITLGPPDNLEVFLTETERLQLSWQPVRSAVSYALQVSRNRLFVDNVIDVEARTKTVATLGLVGEGSFIWRVAATDRQGAQGPWSLPRRFRVSGDRGAVDFSALRRGAGQRDAAGGPE